MIVTTAPPSAAPIGRCRARARLYFNKPACVWCHGPSGRRSSLGAGQIVTRRLWSCDLLLEHNRPVFIGGRMCSNVFNTFGCAVCIQFVFAAVAKTRVWLRRGVKQSRLNYNGCNY